MKIINEKYQVVLESNKSILLTELESLSKSQYTSSELVKTLYKYIDKLEKALKAFYPKYNFDISIKQLDEKNDSVYTIAANNEAQKEKVYKIKKNTDLDSILNNHYRYFFVSNIDKFSESIMFYENSNTNWKSLYNTVVTVPICKKDESLYHVIGFVCVTSPYSLNNTNKNKKIVSLLESTSYELYNLLTEI